MLRLSGELHTTKERQVVGATLELWYKAIGSATYVKVGSGKTGYGSDVSFLINESGVYKLLSPQTSLSSEEFAITLPPTLQVPTPTPLPRRSPTPAPLPSPIATFAPDPSKGSDEQNPTPSPTPRPPQAPNHSQAPNCERNTHANTSLRRSVVRKCKKSKPPKNGSSRSGPVRLH